MCAFVRTEGLSSVTLLWGKAHSCATPPTFFVEMPPAATKAASAALSACTVSAASSSLRGGKGSREGQNRLACRPRSRRERGRWHAQQSKAQSRPHIASWYAPQQPRQQGHPCRLHSPRNLLLYPDHDGDGYDSGAHTHNHSHPGLLVFFPIKGMAGTSECQGVSCSLETGLELIRSLTPKRGLQHVASALAYARLGWA